VLGTLHNLRFYLDFLEEIRQAITLGTFEDLAAEHAVRSAGGGSPETPVSGLPSVPSISPDTSDPHEQLGS
jgi:hypothetical protein